MHSYLLLFFLCVANYCIGQASDFIVVKKKGKTIQSFYSGTQIEFVSITGTYRNAKINLVKDDTLYIQEYLVQRLPTTFGTYILDTAGSFRYAYHYNQISSLGRPESIKFNMKGSGASLMGGGILLVLASGVVYVADRDNFSPELMGAAAALGGIGFLMNKASGRGIKVGKKGYTIEYMDMTP